MKYLHNGIWFQIISHHTQFDLYGSGPLRIIVDRRTKRVICEFTREKSSKEISSFLLDLRNAGIDGSKAGTALRMGLTNWGIKFKKRKGK